MALLVATGVKWVRTDIRWATTERQRGQYDFSHYDALMAALQSHGIRALIILCYDNGLYDGGASPHSPEADAAFARWAAAAVSHFRGRGFIWETWNEPNGSFWHPRPNPNDYSNLAVQVGEAVRRVAPGEILVGPATSGIDRAFLEACFKAGVLNYWSAVTVHPYRDAPPESAGRNFDDLRGLISHYARGKNIPIIVSEWGYPYSRPMDPQTRADMLVRTWLFDLSDGIPLTIWYQWVDPSATQEPKSIVTLSWDSAKQPVITPRPAYSAAKTTTTFLEGHVFRKRMAVGGPQDFVLLFASPDGEDVRIVAWTASGAPHPVTIPASPTRFDVTDDTGAPGPKLNAGPGGLKLALTGSPQFLMTEAPNPKLKSAAGGSGM